MKILSQAQFVVTNYLVVILNARLLLSLADRTGRFGSSFSTSNNCVIKWKSCSASLGLILYDAGNERDLVMLDQVNQESASEA
jgi:hypothetical protein